ncbi:MAG: hypothetical protein PHY05_11445 [Methanothrix sp.]|nr:hypothetical protein [Methanothrix sp.]
MLQNKTASLLILLTIVSVVALSGCTEKSERNPLSVTNMEIVPGQIKTSTIELFVTTYIKNSDEGTAALSSKNTSLILKATSSDRDFLVNQSTAFIGKIAPGETVNVTTMLTLPKKGGYSLEATLFEEGKEMDRGYRMVSNLDSLQADSKAINLRIDGIDFLVRKAAEEKVVIQSDIYVTNFGAKSSQDYKLMLKATDIDSKLVADKQWSNTGIIAPDETVIRSVNLTVPDRYNYVVDVLIWSNSTIVGQGQDYVQLNATTMLGDKERLAARGTRTGAFVNEEAAAQPAEMSVGRFENATMSAEAAREEPGFPALAALAMIGLAAIALRKRRE